MTPITRPTVSTSPPIRASAVTARPSRWIDINGLKDTEQMRLRALLLRANEHTTHDWLEAGIDVAEVRLVDEDASGTNTLSTGPGQPKVVIQIVDADAPAHRAYEHHRLVRPLLLGDLVELLRSLELHLELYLSDDSPQPASRTSVAALGAIGAAATPPANDGLFAPSPAYLLRKWPPEHVLLREEVYAQLAAHFSTQQLTIAQACRIGHVRYTQCWAFIKECMALGLVEVRKSVSALRPVLVLQDMPAPPSQPKAGPHRGGLFARLAAYLG